MNDEEKIRLFVHVEEPSMYEALKILLPRMIEPHIVDIKIIDHGSKQKLLRDLPNRLRGYKVQARINARVLVLVDRDDDDCRLLKQQLEQGAQQAGLMTKSHPDPDGSFQVVNRIVVEELESWFIGDIGALQKAYRGVPVNLGRKAAYRNPDAVAGGTWEALHRVLKGAGHYTGAHMPKIEVARSVAEHMRPAENRSRSFQVFAEGLVAITAP